MTAVGVLGLAGMVALGPVVGGVVGTAPASRPLLVGVAVVGLAGLVMGVLVFEADSPADLERDMGFDWSAIPVAAAAATVLPFLGVSWLSWGCSGCRFPGAAGVRARGRRSCCAWP
jgi:hypothetical protein